MSEAKEIYTISKNVSKRLKVYNNIDSQALYQPPSLVGRYQNKSYGNYILSVGRLDLLKRNDLLIRSLVHCEKSITAKIAGRGQELENLIKLSKQIGVSERVEFLGFVSDEELLELYANAMTVYFAPVDEDYGLITLEAFLSKKPVITCCDSGGVLEFVSDENNGFVCNVMPEDIGRAIEKISKNKNICKEFGESGYQTVKDITWDNVVDRLTQTIR
jgi:glycosyltransferase involved in cell wall biosynthesis